MDFGLRPAARQLETPRDAEVRPVRKYGPLDIRPEATQLGKGTCSLCNDIRLFA